MSLISFWDKSTAFSPSLVSFFNASCASLLWYRSTIFLYVLLSLSFELTAIKLMYGLTASEVELSK